MKKIDYDRAFWKMRSKKYDKLEWVSHRKYLDAFIKAGKFRKTDVVLDVGTGTGVIAHAISPLVQEVIGFDKSQDMLEHSNWHGNMYFIKRDVRDLLFADRVFDKVTARLVFHHILKRTQKAMNECYRVLKKGGVMVLSEGVPPTKRVKKNYVEIFQLKEKRLTFYENDLIKLMSLAGFKNIKCNNIYLKKMSVRNWLESSGIAKRKQKKIFNLHKNAPDYFKKDYNLFENKNDCFIDMKMAILTGTK